MADSKHSMYPLPLFIIDTCSSKDDGELPKAAISLKYNSLPRSFSLPNRGETYKDLCGLIHYSLSNRLKTFFTRSRSYPNNYLTNEQRCHSRSVSTSINVPMNLLDPYNGKQSPGGSSSRCSLYGSFFDLSESGYYPLSIPSNKKLLAFDGYPLLVADKSSRLSTNTYQEKCNNWLSHMITK
jgi:hypothetical protein